MCVCVFSACEHKKLSPETNLCIMDIPKSPSKRSSPCRLIGELFEDRMDDERYMKFQSQLKDYAKSFNKEFYIGKYTTYNPFYFRVNVLNSYMLVLKKNTNLC